MKRVDRDSKKKKTKTKTPSRTYSWKVRKDMTTNFERNWMKKEIHECLNCLKICDTVFWLFSKFDKSRN